MGGGGDTFACLCVTGGDGVLILGPKALREQVDIDMMEGLWAKTLGHGELAEHDHDLAAVTGAASTVAVGLRRVTVSLRAMHTIADAEEDPNAVRDSRIEELLAAGRGHGH